MSHETLPEHHRTHRIGWLRAAVLGANDGILSTGSLIVGVAAAHASRPSILVAGIASLVAGAMSMAAGEYVSVSSQSDVEQADLELEKRELETNVRGERRELAAIYVARGIEPELAQQVAKQLMDFDALGAHARDELGISTTVKAQPVQAALASAASFSAGAALPLTLVFLTPLAWLIPSVVGGVLVFLAALGALAANAGGANTVRGAARVAFWGALALGLTMAIGRLSGAVL